MILTKKEAEALVDKGIERLMRKYRRKKPWIYSITDKIKICNAYACPLGQVYDYFWDTPKSFIDIHEKEDTAVNGFNITCLDGKWEDFDQNEKIMNIAWNKKINAYRKRVDLPRLK